MRHRFKSARQRRAVMARLRARGKGMLLHGTGRQVGVRKSIKADKRYKALRPGKRVSVNGNEYWETRRNRSDLKGKRI